MATYSTTAPVVDPRFKIAEMLVEGLNLQDVNEIERHFAPYFTPDIVLIGSWVNAIKFEAKQHREIRGLRPISELFSKQLSAVPDIVISFQERVLYKKPDGSSFLMFKFTATGSLLLSIVMRNALSTGRAIFARNGFFSRVYHLAVDRNGRPSTANNSSGDSSSDSMSGEENQQLGQEISQESNDHLKVGGPRKSGDNRRRVRVLPRESNYSEITIKDEEASFSLASAAVASVTNRGHEPQLRPKATKRALFDRTHFDFRRRRIQDDQVEVVTEDTQITVAPVVKPGTFMVTATTVVHFNPDHQIYRIETFKRLVRRAFF